MAKGANILPTKSNGRTFDDVRSWDREADNEHKRRLIAQRPYDHLFHPDGSPKTPVEIAQMKRKEGN